MIDETPGNLSRKRHPSGHRLCGQKSPHSGTVVRTSGSSFRTLFTRLLTARRPKGPSWGSRVISSSAGSGDSSARVR